MTDGRQHGSGGHPGSSAQASGRQRPSGDATDDAGRVVEGGEHREAGAGDQAPPRTAGRGAGDDDGNA